ncbi:MAG: hypothetical protein ACE14V_10210 [bacterium]
MDINILLAVIGIIVSIVVGFVTFYLADKSARRNRWNSAREMILRDLSKSLGEGTVPDASVIEATIRSILRGYNANDLSVITVEEIADDLLRQITADPFLDAERRKKLQNEVLKLKQVRTKLEEEVSFEESVEGPIKIESKIEGLRRWDWSNALSILAGILSTFIVAVSFISISKIADSIKQFFVNIWPEIGATLIPVVATIIFSLISLLISSRDKRK